MARIKQWVNLELDPKYLDKECKTTEEMGRFIHLEAELDKKDASSIVYLLISADKENNIYDKKERSLAPDLHYGGQLQEAKVTEDGKAKFKVKLSVGGGDKFKFKALDFNKIEKELEDEYETHRRIYYQVIDMADIKGLDDYTFLEDEFKNSKREIHLVNISKNRSIDHIHNISNLNQIYPACDPKYNKSKDPYCFVIVWVDCIACGPKIQWITEKFTPTSGSTVPLRVPKNTQLWKDIDMVPDNTKNWFVEALFTYTDAFGKDTIFKIPGSDVKFTSYDMVTVITDHFPKEKLGYKNGQIGVRVRLADGFYGGLASSEKNFIAIATRGWRNNPIGEKIDKKATVIHEVGHKVGMVPNSTYQGDGPILGKGLLHQEATLDRQYDEAFIQKGRAAHCNNKSCTMWWTNEYNKTTFCAECQKSLRKINLNISEINGFDSFSSNVVFYSII